MNVKTGAAAGWRGVIDRYAEFLPVTDQTPVVTLLEGNTPLVPVPRFAEAIGAKIELFLKCEGLNPTCSFKDRGMTLAVSKAVEKGARIIVCASTGNTSASAAAYAARAGIKCVVLLPEGNVALGKLAQALICGAETVEVRGGFDVALNIVRELGKTGLVEVVNSVNPDRIEGQKTSAFEVCDALGDAPDYHFLPIGNAGNMTAYWKGYCEYHAAKKSDTLPKMFGWQAAGAAPMVDGHPIDNPQSVASAIRIGNPASWQPAAKAIQESGGAIGKISDEEIMYAYHLLARTEGVFAEPASAAPLAGLIRCVKQGEIPVGSIIVATMTGHGLKDPDIAIKQAGVAPKRVEATLESVRSAIGL